MNLQTNFEPCEYSDGGWSFSVATTPEDKLACYQVRYEGLTTQLGDERYANHEDGTYIDPWDDEYAVILMARHRDGMVVGTVRYQWRFLRAFPADELYDFAYFSKVTGCIESAISKRVSLIDRASVRPSFQGQGLFSKLELLAERISIRNKVQLHTALVSHENPRVIQMFEAMGWQRSGRNVIYNLWAGVEMFKLLEPPR